MKKPIYLIDLTHESKLGFGSDTMPLQLGLIGAYCAAELGDEVDVQIFKFIREFEEAVLARPPFIVGASNYLWNIDLGYKSVQAAKRQFPDIISVFGGPNYPDDREEQIRWLSSHPEIDFYIHKDGEVPFARLVRFLLDNPDAEAAKKAQLPSCHALHDGQPFLGVLEPRLRDLTAIPSPYVTGLMDKFFDQRLIPAIQTNRGCPFSCTFCTEGSRYYSKVFRTSFERKKAEVDYIVERIEHTKTLRVTDSNFGMFPEDVEFCRYLSGMQDRTGYPEYVMCSAGKNNQKRILECNRLLGGAMRLTASVQSLSPVVLENIKRNNISLDSIMHLSDQVSDTETHSYSELILALPGDSLAITEECMSGLMDAGISNITQHQLALIHGTALNSPASREKYSMKSMFRPIQRCVGSYRWGDKSFPAIEVEEICVANDTLSFADYLEARRLYLTVGLFYNDRIFGEIHALLRLMKLSTFGWVKQIHDNLGSMDPTIRALYDDFTKETKAELWETHEQLMEDVSANIDHYVEGESGGNIIYKYRAKATVNHFEQLHRTAYACLRTYLQTAGGDCGSVVEDMELFSRHQKFNIFDLDYEARETFSYDIPRLISDLSFTRGGGTLQELQYVTPVRFRHTSKQRETIRRQLDFYGSDLSGLTMLISRFPMKRFYRHVEGMQVAE